MFGELATGATFAAGHDDGATRLGKNDRKVGAVDTGAEHKTGTGPAGAGDETRMVTGRNDRVARAASPRNSADEPASCLRLSGLRCRTDSLHRRDATIAPSGTSRRSVLSAGHPWPNLRSLSYSVRVGRDI
mgnify:CR=1 FL=1